MAFALLHFGCSSTLFFRQGVIMQMGDVREDSCKARWLNLLKQAMRGRLVAFYTVPLAVIAFLIAFAAGAFFHSETASVLGLTWDVLGAVTLVAGLLRGDASAIRQRELRQGGQVPSDIIQGIPYHVAFWIGSKEPLNTISFIADEYTENFCGIFLLGFGFLFQLMGHLF
jgi:hypothetical protein